jgi:flavorubredoxin/flavin reductase (DIM6/NTAB) family NADH-FMN oxidoreductase RutF
MTEIDTGTLLRDVQVARVGADTQVFRCRSWNRLRFEVEYGLERGTTANSYLIEGTAALALIDPPGESFRDLFWQHLAPALAQCSRSLDYIIIGHINPNRATTLRFLLEQFPQVKMVCSNPASKILESFYDEIFAPFLQGQPLPLQVIRGEETLALGGSHTLTFALTPTPRWPGGLMTYDPGSRLLFTDKFFAIHHCNDAILDQGWTQYLEDHRYYFDGLMAPQARQVLSALERVQSYKTLAYAPGHGPIVRYAQRELLTAYRQWCQAQQQQSLRVVLLYASAYGNTGTLAKAIAQGVTKSGVRVEMLDCEAVTPEEIRSAVESCDGVIIGSPTLGGHAPTPIQTALGVVLATLPKDKLTGVFGSFGWSGEAIDLIEGKLKDAGYRAGFQTIRVKFKPDDRVLKTCEEAGTDFAQALKKAKKRIDRQVSGGLTEGQLASTEQAVGRLLGSLCVLTAQKGEVNSGMLASWVSQASFNPPGITVAVAKDRAVESLTYRGDYFVLNILDQAQNLPLQKHFLKPFAPGADRFEGIDIERSSHNIPILKGALAYLECQVQNRLECADHWVVYATIEQGKVLHSEGRTAVHYRKTGSRY